MLEHKKMGNKQMFENEMSSKPDFMGIELL